MSENDRFEVPAEVVEHPTIKFLKTLGKTSVFIRSWVGKGYDDVPNLYKGGPGRAYNVRCDRSGNDLEHLEWPEEEWPRLIQELSRQNSEDLKVTKTFPYQIGGWSPYLVVNNGGHKAADIKDCPALFIEFDAPISKGEAKLKIRAFPLRPSIVIESRAGYHVYYLLEKPTSPNMWRQFQWRLIEYFESDTGIEDPSRCMRLPGFQHLKKDADPFLIEMKTCEPTHRYALEEFDGILPEVPTWRLRLERDSKPYSPIKLEDGTEWDIRDFAHVLANYQENSRREWDTCQCPVHGGAGHSKDSLHINSNTGAYHCWSGCDPKDIYREVCKLAGWTRPKPEEESSTKPVKASKSDPASFLESTEWDDFQNVVSLLVQNIDNQMELEFRLRNLCQQYGMPINFGQQVKQLVSGAITPFEPIWVEDFLAQKTEDRQWVIASHIPLGTVIDLCAAGGLGKTTLVYDWCRHIISGTAWNGYRIRKGKVLIVQDDEPETDTREKLDIAKFYELPPRQCAITFKWQFSEIDQLVRYIEKENILLCVIDSLGSTNMGRDRDRTEFADNLKVLRDVANQFGCTFLVLDHINKGGTQLGTVAVRNTVSELIYMMAPSEDEKRMYDLGRNHRILWFDKSRAGLGGTKFVLEQQPLDYSWAHHGLLENINDTRGDDVLRNLYMLLAADSDARYTVSQIRNHLEMEYSATELFVEQLRRTGMIDSEWCIHGRDRYRVYYLKADELDNDRKFEPANEKLPTDWEEL